MSHDAEPVYVEWPHAPSHLFEPEAFYFVTVGTYMKKHLFRTPEDKTLLLKTLSEQAERFEWRLQAWAVLSNHYHFVAQAPEDAESLRAMLRSVHSLTARHVNSRDAAPGRKVWHRYRDTCLTQQKSYLARLNYVHCNPVKHGVVERAWDYPWCSMRWFQKQAEEGFRERVLSFDADRVAIEDDF